MTVTQKEIAQALRAASDRTDIFSGYYNSTHFAKLADYIEQDGIAPPEGYAIVPIDSLKYWRELVDLNPKDLAPRIEAMLTAAKESL